MYSFIDTTENEKGGDQLSSVAITFNGRQIDTLIDGYRTLRVAGREVVSTELNTEEVIEGDFVLNKRLPRRELEITYLMKSEDGTSFSSNFKRLRQLLSSEGEVEITFNDEPATFYYGQLTEMESVDDSQNIVVGSFLIHCSSPFKYGPIMYGSTVTIDTFYPTRPETLTLNVGEAVNKIKINHNRYTISATGTFNTGSRVVFYFDKDSMRMTVNDVESTYMVDLNSDFENFELAEGQEITSPQGTVTAKMRERWL